MVDCKDCTKPLDIKGSFLRQDQLCGRCADPLCVKCGLYCVKCLKEMETVVKLMKAATVTVINSES